MGNLCCQYTGCAWRRHPGLPSNADNIQGVLGKGTLGYKLMLRLRIRRVGKNDGPEIERPNVKT